MWYMHYGAPAHFSHAVRDVLSKTYHDRWIDLWGHLKSLVYAASIDNEEAHHHCIVDACQTIRSYPCIIEWLWRSCDLSKHALNF
jgi:hypothetical protein